MFGEQTNILFPVKPKNKKKPTKCQNVLGFLKQAKMNKPVYFVEKDLVDPGWVPLYVLQQGFIGGTAAYQRIVDLRDRIYSIPIKFKRFVAADGKKSNITIYSLDCNPLLVDVDNCCLKENLKKVS